MSDLVAVELAQLTRKGALKSTTAAGVQLKDDKQLLEFLTSNLPNNAKFWVHLDGGDHYGQQMPGLCTTMQ